MPPIPLAHSMDRTALTAPKISLATLLALVFAMAASAAEAQHCAEERFENANYVVCTLDPAAADLRLFWKNAAGEAHRSFASVAAAVASEDRQLVFAMNAGMYQSDFSPVGLYVEGGAQLIPPNLRTVEGPARQVPNFYKRPNGVFYFGAAGAGILPTEEFVAAQLDVAFATQSGPMLVIDNELHPALIPGSTDRTRRSGVGVCEGSQVRFAISNDGVNFHDFARLFRDRLACPNALFLDGGSGVGLFSPQLGRNDFSWHGGFGPIVGLVD